LRGGIRTGFAASWIAKEEGLDGTYHGKSQQGYQYERKKAYDHEKLKHSKLI
jgi:hypothetical protein